jgi:elongation of very long chain fatty acids protein 6
MELLDWVRADPLQAADPAAWAVVHRDDAFDVREALPALAPLYPFARENGWDHGGELTLWAREHMDAPVVLVCLYLVFIFGVQRAMRGRAKAYDLRRAQIVWNAMLSAFSWWGMFRTVPLLVALVTAPPRGGEGAGGGGAGGGGGGGEQRGGFFQGFFQSYCGDPSRYGEKGAAALMMGMFIFSKVPELGDTVFIVLQKRKLLFLQWYHHITVLLYTWHSYATRNSAGIWFISMNYTVHAVMYMYFAIMGVSGLQKDVALRDLKAGSPEQTLALQSSLRLRESVLKWAPLVTVMQISQMFVGVAIMVLIALQSETIGLAGEGAVTRRCYVGRASFLAGLSMYFSYFVLFVYFAVDRYCCGTKKKVD